MKYKTVLIDVVNASRKTTVDMLHFVHVSQWPIGSFYVDYGDQDQYHRASSSARGSFQSHRHNLGNLISSESRFQFCEGEFTFFTREWSHFVSDRCMHTTATSLCGCASLSYLLPVGKGLNPRNCHWKVLMKKDKQCSFSSLKKVKKSSWESLSVRWWLTGVLLTLPQVSHISIWSKGLFSQLTGDKFCIYLLC